MTITLYAPDGIVTYPNIRTYGIAEGVLTFVADGVEIRTTLPFMISGPRKK